MARPMVAGERKELGRHQRLYLVAALFVGLLIGTGAASGQVRRVTPDMAPERIRQVLASAKAGDTVVWCKGTYRVTEPLPFRSGVTYAGEGLHQAVLDASAQPAAVRFEMSDGSHHLTFTRLHFRNIGFVCASGSQQSGVSHVIFEDCLFSDGKPDADGSSGAYILAGRSQYVTVRRCTFLRDANCLGLGVVFWKAWDGQVLDCHFGAWGEQYPAAQHGYFVAAIYVQGSGSGTNDEAGYRDRSVRIRIEGNEITRNPDIDQLPADHGIYALGAYDLYLGYNIISGWPTRADGGAAKLRDGDRYYFEQNLMERSGLLLYEYRANKPDHLKDVVVKDNVAQTWVKPGPDDRATGISYWRDWPGGTEQAIRLEGNVAYGGELTLHPPLNADRWNEGAGGVFANRASYISLPAGVRAEGNAEITDAGPDRDVLTCQFRERIANRRPWRWDSLSSFFDELWKDWPSVKVAAPAAP
ncbi:MAG: hypothetical protein ACE149_19700 [Armatimonadota bacterium]